MKKLLCLSLFYLLLTSCSIRGNYYILNKSKAEIKVQIRYSEFCDWQREFKQIRVKEYQDEKIRFLTYQNMDDLQITMDTNGVRIISFILPENHLAYIGSGINTHFTNIEELQIINSEEATIVEEEDIQIKSNRGGYVGIYTYK